MSQRSARFQRRARLRLLAPGELTDAAITVYQELGGLILRYTATSTLLSLASLIFVFAYVIPSLLLTNHPDNLKAQLGEVVFSVVTGVAVAAPLMAIGVAYSSAVITGLVSDYMNGQVPVPKEHLATARKLLPRLALLALWQTLSACVGVIIGLGFLMLSAVVGDATYQDNLAAGLVSVLAIFGVIGGFIAFPIVVGRQILMLPIVVIEGLGVRAAAKRNNELMKGTKIHPSGYGHASTIWFLTFFLVILIWAGVGSLFGMFDIDSMIGHWLQGSMFNDLVKNAVQDVPLFITIWTVIPVWCAGATLLYFERRTRLEGYDIEALAVDLGKHVKKNRFEL
jgi:hypothetical protein